MVQALAGAAGSLLGAFSGQSRKAPANRPVIDSAIPAIAATNNPRVANKIRKEAQQERLFNLLSQPEVLGYVMALGGLILSNNIPFSGDAEKNTFIQAIASTLSVAMGMGYAGVGDLTSLSVAIAAGSGSLLGGLIDLREIANIDVGDFWDNVNPLAPIWSLFGIK